MYKNRLLLLVLSLCALSYCSAAYSQTNHATLPTIIDLLLQKTSFCGNNVVEPGEICDDGNQFSGDYCENTCLSKGPLYELNLSGRFGEPENTHILDGVFYFDVQASIPEVNWQTLDRLYIPAGEYDAIWIGNLPVRSPERPLVITNHGGQVKVVPNRNAKIVIEGGSNWVLTGRYDPISETGHTDFRGHADGDYANAQGKYGIYIEQGYYASNGLAIRQGRADSHATDFEVEFIELAEAGFAAINIKNDNKPDAHINNVMIHDLYIRDPETECMYIGNTNSNANLQHRFENLWIFNNRGIRCGAEALQLTHVGDGTRAFNNVFLAASSDWKDPFQAFQEGHLQVTTRPGDIVIENNIFIGGANSMISPRIERGSRDIQGASQAGELLIRNNYFSHSRGTQLSYIHRRPSNLDTKIRFEGNYFGPIVSQREEVFENSLAEDFYFQTRFNTNNPLIFSNNTFAAGRRGFSTIDTNINGVLNNIQAQGNQYGSLPAPEFKDSGLPADYDYRRIEVWSDCSRIFGNRPISFEVGDLVRHHSNFYKLTASIPQAYQCDEVYWTPCLKQADESYLPNEYELNDIVDTVDEGHYKLTSTHDDYLCTPQERFQNPSPREDPNWTKVVINPFPNEATNLWQAQPKPKDDLRLLPDAEFSSAGLLDVAH